MRGFGRLPQHKVALSERAKASAIGPLPKGKGGDPQYWKLLSKIGQMRREGWRGHQMLQKGFSRVDLEVVGYGPKDFEPEPIEDAERTEGRVDGS